MLSFTEVKNEKNVFVNVVLHCAHKCGHAKVCTMYVHLSRQKKKPTELMVMKGAEIACLSDHSLRFPSWVISLLNLAFLNSNSNFGSASISPLHTSLLLNSCLGNYGEA